ncbi:hypothetical protein TRIUR3_17121 [Triticum urartu]|nr:hypothetical protein TRIUR3_17121 [Triticum urartu]
MTGSLLADEGCSCQRLHRILEDINYKLFRSSSFLEGNKEATTEEIFEWNSDDDVENENLVKHCCLEDNKKAIIEKKLDWKQFGSTTIVMLLTIMIWLKSVTGMKSIMMIHMMKTLRYLGFTHIKRLS